MHSNTYHSKVQAVRMVKEDGKRIAEVARELDLEEQKHWLLLHKVSFFSLRFQPMTAGPSMRIICFWSGSMADLINARQSSDSCSIDQNSCLPAARYLERFSSEWIQ